MADRSNPWPLTWTPKLERLVRRLSVGQGGGLGGSPKLDDIITKSPWFDLRAFLPSGFVIDGSVDYATELQAWIDAAELVSGVLYTPVGTFLTNSALNITDDIKMIRGEGFDSVIRAGAAIAAIFDFTSGGTDATNNQFVTIKDIWLDGNHNADYCIYSTLFTRSNFIRVWAWQSNVANIALNTDMWINNFFFCNISHGNQDGLVFLGAGAANAVNIFGCAIEANDRIGIYAGSPGSSINIVGNTIEGNGVTGIWATNARALNIDGNYFETNNVEGGVVVTNPTSFTIKADIILSGSIYPVINFVAPLRNVSIKNNSHNIGANGDCMYYASSIDIGEISGNYNTTTGKVCLGIYGHRSYSSISGLKMYNNRDADGLYSDPIQILDAEPAGSSYVQLRTTHDIQIADVLHKNYMPQDFTTYTKVVDAGKSSELYRNADAFRGMDAFIIKKDGDSSDAWGATLNIDNDFPELLGKLCYFGAWVKWTGDTDNAVRLYTSTTGYHTNATEAAPSDWKFISVLFVMPASGATSWKAGFRKLAAGTTDIINIAYPVLARIGDGYLSHIPDNSILEVFQKGTTGGYYTVVSEATVDITAVASITCQVNVPSGSRLIGCQIRVDTALAAGETWDAEWHDGASLQSIVSNAAVAKNTKVNKFHDDNANTPITDAETDIVITKNSGGSFTAQGTIRCIAYYLSLRALGDKS